MQNGDQREILPIALSPLPERLELAKENITDCKGFIVFFFSPLYSTLHIYTFTGCHKLSETK